MNSGGQVVINTPGNVRKMANRIRAVGVIPELELFDTGDCHLARDLIAEDVLQGPGLFSLVLGVKYGFNASPETMLYGRNLLPDGAIWSGFGIGRSEFPMVAQAWLLGGHVRVGMEDNLHISKGVLAKTNAELVTQAADILRLPRRSMRGRCCGWPDHSRLPLSQRPKRWWARTIWVRGRDVVRHRSGR
jgi:uncharacterized protein (DUF849 family)